MSGHNKDHTRTLRYYMKLLAEKQGINWDSDNDAEIEYIVNGIVNEAVEKAVAKIQGRSHE